MCILRMRLRISTEKLVMKPGKLQKAGLLFRFWGWTGPSRDPDPAQLKAIWRM